MNPALFFSIAGGIAILWGGFCAVFADRAAGFGRAMQRIYGQRAADRVTPARTRLIGIVLVVFGAILVVLAVTGVLPNRPV